MEPEPVAHSNNDKIHTPSGPAKPEPPSSPNWSFQVSSVFCSHKVNMSRSHKAKAPHTTFNKAEEAFLSAVVPQMVLPDATIFLCAVAKYVRDHHAGIDWDVIHHVCATDVSYVHVEDQGRSAET